MTQTLAGSDKYSCRNYLSKVPRQPLRAEIEHFSLTLNQSFSLPQSAATFFRTRIKQHFSSSTLTTGKPVLPSKALHQHGPSIINSLLSILTNLELYYVFNRYNEGFCPLLLKILLANIIDNN